MYEANKALQAKAAEDERANSSPTHQLDDVSANLTKSQAEATQAAAKAEMIQKGKAKQIADLQAELQRVKGKSQTFTIKTNGSHEFVLGQRVGLQHVNPEGAATIHRNQPVTVVAGTVLGIPNESTKCQLSVVTVEFIAEHVDFAFSCPDAG